MRRAPGLHGLLSATLLNLACGDATQSSEAGDSAAESDGTSGEASDSSGESGEESGTTGGCELPELSLAQEAWVRGDIEEAHELILQFLECESTDEALALATATSFAKGDYPASLAYHAEIDPAWADYETLDDAVVQAHCHLDQCDQALAFAEMRGVEEAVLVSLAQRADNPLSVSLDSLSVVDFDLGDPLTQYIPAFPTVINGMPIASRLDTGGTWVVSSVEVGEALGVTTVCAGMGMQGNTPTNLCHGIIDTLQLGDATFTNVPLITLDTLNLPEPILGTNIFQRLYSTLDYPRDRLVLSPRGDAALAQQHLDMLGAELDTVPFYMWSDHFMFTRGGLGDRDDLNFFMDSGLVAVDGMSGQQAAVMASATALENFGAVAPNSSGDFVPLVGDIRIGTLSQAGHTSWNQPNPVDQLGGVRIDALISHAWLNQYAWTLDFDQRVYGFRE